MSFGVRLRERREQKKLTQAQLGLGLGTDGKDASKAVVYGWEKDQHHPRADQLAAICERLSCSADYLLFGRQISDLLPEVELAATKINALPPRHRAWMLQIVKEAFEGLELAKSDVLQGGNADARISDTTDPDEHSPSRKRATG